MALNSHTREIVGGIVVDLSLLWKSEGGCSTSKQQCSAATIR